MEVLGPNFGTRILVCGATLTISNPAVSAKEFSQLK